MENFENKHGYTSYIEYIPLTNQEYRNESVHYDTEQMELLIIAGNYAEAEEKIKAFILTKGKLIKIFHINEMESKLI